MRYLILLIFAIMIAGTFQGCDALLPITYNYEVRGTDTIKVETRYIDRPVYQPYQYNGFYNQYYNNGYYYNNNTYFRGFLNPGVRVVIPIKRRRHGSNRTNINTSRSRNRGRVSPTVRSNRKPRGKNPRRKVQARQRRSSKN